jgi:hypothetical protein
MEQLLNRGSAISDLAYLRILQLVHIQVSNLVEDLKAYELSSGIPRTPAEVTEFRRSITGSVPASTAGTAIAVGHMLETGIEELFVPYTEGQRYLERESRSLGALYSGLLANFARYHVRLGTSRFARTICLWSLQEKTHKGKSSMFDRMVNQLSAAAATTSTGGASTTSAQAAAALMRFGGINTDRNQDKTEEPPREEDGQLSVSVAETMLKWHAEAIGRCVELSPSNDM